MQRPRGNKVVLQLLVYALTAACAHDSGLQESYIMPAQGGFVLAPHIALSWEPLAPVAAAGSQEACSQICLHHGSCYYFMFCASQVSAGVGLGPAVCAGACLAAVRRRLTSLPRCRPGGVHFPFWAPGLPSLPPVPPQPVPLWRPASGE